MAALSVPFLVTSVLLLCTKSTSASFPDGTTPRLVPIFPVWNVGTDAYQLLYRQWLTSALLPLYATVLAQLPREHLQSQVPTTDARSGQRPVGRRRYTAFTRHPYVSACIAVFGLALLGELLCAGTGTVQAVGEIIVITSGFCLIALMLAVCAPLFRPREGVSQHGALFAIAPRRRPLTAGGTPMRPSRGARSD